MNNHSESNPSPDATKGWQRVSDRKIRVGLVGYGVCKFASAFGLQNHPANRGNHWRP